MADEQQQDQNQQQQDDMELRSSEFAQRNKIVDPHDHRNKKEVEGDEQEQTDDAQTSRKRFSRQIQDIEDLNEVKHRYTELEQKSSRLGHEVHELRELTKELLMASRPPATEEKSDLPEELYGLDEDQQRAVKKLIDNEIGTVRTAVEEQKRNAALVAFESKHPQYKQQAETEEFVQWVQSSPYRTKLYERADKYDLDAADELFTGFSEHISADQQSETRASKLRSAGGERGGSGGNPSRKKQFNSADLIQLKMRDPEKYNQMWPEIEQAYREGRVR